MNSRVLSYMIQADIPVHLTSDPGTGKTAYLNALGEAMGLPVHTEILSMADPTDFGWPRESDGVIKRMPVDWIKRAVERAHLIFFDEITLAPRACIAAMLRGVNERRFGELALHPDTRFVAASNPAEFTGVELLPQMANRFAHVAFEDIVPLSAWRDGMLSGFPLPTVDKLSQTWEASIPTHRALIASFCTAASTEAFKRPTDPAAMGRAWPSRRTWDMVARVSAACEAGSEDDSLAIASLVGEGAARAYVAWRHAQDLPHPAEVLAHASDHPLPDADDRLYVVLSACAAHAVAKPDSKLWSACWIVLKRACDMKKADIAIVAGRVLASNMPTGAVVPKEIAALLPMLQLAGGKGR